MHNAINFIAFQAGWFTSILCAANGMPWSAAGAVLMVVAVHLARARKAAAELKLALAAALVGAIFENALSLAGWTRFTGGELVPGTAPLWIVAQWMMFATTLNLSLSWLKPKPIVAAIFGAVGAPLSYFAGERLDAIQIPDRDAALVALALGWALLLPLLLRLARRWDGYAISPASEITVRVGHA